MEIQAAKRLVNAYTNWRNTVSAFQQLQTDPRYATSRNIYTNLVAAAGNRPWPRHVQRRINNAFVRTNKTFSNYMHKIAVAQARLDNAAQAALLIFGPQWVRLNQLNIRPFIRLLETANARARTIVRKYMGRSMANKAAARRQQRNSIAHELAFYVNNNNPNAYIRPSNVRSKKTVPIR
jgi:hypothetical protein